MKRSSVVLVFVVACLTIILDQVSKRLILNTFQPGEIRPVIDGVFNLTLTFNRGAAFGLWSGLSSGWREVVLAATILVALTFVAYLMTRSHYQTFVAQSSLAAILGGAIGNVIDRVKFGAVVDFLDFYLGTYHWPAFNVADSAICVGVVLLILFQTPVQSPVDPKISSS